MKFINIIHTKQRKSFINVLILLFILVVSPISSYAQNQKVSLSGSNITLSMAFEQIEKQTGLSVDYDAKTIDTKKAIITIPKKSTLSEALSQILQETDYTFLLNGSHIIILHKENDVNKAKQVKSKQVSGVVRDSKGETLIGVSVMETGTKNGTITDINGNFSIEVQAVNSILTFSYIGYNPEKVAVNGQSILSIKMSADEKKLEEVVVTALGIKKETKALTYSIQKIDAVEIVGVKDANLMNSLAGKIAGVTINASSSGIGGAARVVMRGTKSITGNNNALYVIDGIPMPSLQNAQPSDLYSGMGQSGDGISNLNPDDIESMSILTGAAAAALYGSDAANGVVMITTKKGISKNFSVNFSNSTTFSAPFITPKFQNTYGSEPGSYYSWGSKLTTPSTYNPTDFFQTGYNTNNSVNLSTGTEKNQTYFSLASSNARGIIQNNTLSRYNISIRNSSSFLDDKLDLDLNAMYMNVDEQNMLAQGQYFNPLIPIYLFPRGDDIAKYQTYERYNATRNFKTQYWPYGDLGLQMQNPYWITNRDMFTNHKDRFMIGSALKYTISKGLNATGRAKVDNNTSVNEKKYYASTSGLFADAAGAYYREDILTRQIYADAMLNMDRYVGDFSIVASVGTSVKDVKYGSSALGGNLQSVQNLFTYANLNTSSLKKYEQTSYHDQTQAIFATAQIGYKSKAYLDLTARNDWCTALAQSTSTSIFYPSIGLSSILTDLLPIKSKALSFVKARVSYSEVGNSPQRYVSIATYPVSAGYPQTTTYLPSAGLQPERTKSTEVGLNCQFFGDKVKLDVTLYQSSTYNQLFNPTLSTTSGYNSFYINAGRIDNQGIELSLGLKQNLNKVVWNSTLIYSLNRNKIKKLLTSYTTSAGETISMTSMDMGGTSSYKMMLTEGGAMGDIYVNTLKTDEHGYIKVDPTSQSVTADANHFVKAGNSNPNYNLGWRNNFEWKDFSLGFLINARVGGVGVSITQALIDTYGVSEASAEARDNGGALVNGVRIPAQSYYETIGGGTSGVGSMYVYSATNVRLAEFTLGYDLPINKYCKAIKSFTISLVGRNLFMFYNKAPFDPESTASTGTYFQGIDYFMQPSLRTFGFSVKLSF